MSVAGSRLGARPTRLGQALLRYACCVVVASFAIHATALAQATWKAPVSPSGLTLDRVLGPEFDARSFGPARWLDGGRRYTTVDGERRQIVGYDTRTGARTMLLTAPWPIADYRWSPDGTKALLFTNTARVWRARGRGDYYVMDLRTGALRQLGRGSAPSTLLYASWSPDGKRVAYLRRDVSPTEMPANLYVEDIASGDVRQLTHDASLRNADGTGRTVINGTGDWVYEEELGLRRGYEWSPDGSRIAYWQLDATAVRDFHLLNDTDSLYSRVITIPYPKAGTTNSSVRIGVVPAAGGPTTWMKVPGDPSDGYIARIAWSTDSRDVLLQHFDRPQQTLGLLAANARTGAVRPVTTERDSTWVDVVNDLRWLRGGTEFLWIGEGDGWRHVYRVARDGRRRTLITHGPYDVIDVVAVDETGGWLYYIASPTDATQRYLYRTRLDGSGTAERLSPATQPGTHEYQVSPNACWAIHTFSSASTPPVIDLVSLPDHRVRRVFVDNHAVAAAAAALPKGEFFRVTIPNSASGAAGAPARITLDGRMVRPPDFDTSKKYPVLVHVYGEPAAQLVLDRWPGGSWTDYVASLGYIVISVDNRGTPAPKGHDWRHVVYGSVGRLAADEQAAALRTLARQHPYLDTTRVAVWGWSGGGSMTLHAMFRYPELYKVGIAIASVPDQRYYDTIYQERYMGTPQRNPDGYQRGSPITYADGLRGSLLIVAGTGDDNVHFQGDELLINRLIALGKQFEIMPYPNRTHAISEGPGTATHLYTTLTRYLVTHLPPGAR